MQTWAEHFYKSRSWKNTRAEYLRKVGGLCEQCLSRGIYTPAEIIHHKQHLTEENIKNAKIALNFDNLEALCRICHAEQHNAYMRRFSFNDDGVCIPRLSKMDF